MVVITNFDGKKTVFTETVKETVKDCFCEKEDEENKNTSDEL